MTLSLRLRLLACVVPPIVLVAVLAAVNVSGPLVALAAGCTAAAAAGLIVLLTTSVERLKAAAAKQLDATRSLGAVADPPAPPPGDGTEQVMHTLTVLSRRLQECHRHLTARDQQFQTALVTTTAALKDIATNAKSAAPFGPPPSPWPALSDALNVAVYEVANGTVQANRRASAFAGVMNDLPDPVLVIDHYRNLLFANAAAGRLFEADPTQLAKRPLVSLFREPGLNLWDDAQTQAVGVDAFQRWLTLPAGGTCEVIAAAGDDGTRVAASVLPAAGRVTKTAVVLLLKDLTTQKRQDSDLRLQHRRTVAQRLCLLVENEARPALESIRTSATLLSQAAKQIGQRERFVPKVERMLDELSRQEVVITLLGWLGRLTKTFGSSQDLSEVRLRDQVDEVADKLKAVYGDRGNGIAVGGDAGWLIADEEWVSVLLTGLLLHANMTAKQETVRVDLRRRSVVSADREQGEVVVRYRGTPLSEDAIADIREPFRRPNSLALESTSELGFPLGLAVANRIAGLMGGQLEVEVAGAECVVRVLLPTRGTGSRVESQSAVARAVQVAAELPAAVPSEPADLMGDFLVGGGKADAAEPTPADTPVPVGAAPDLLHDAEETLGDWFPAAK